MDVRDTIDVTAQLAVIAWAVTSTLIAIAPGARRCARALRRCPRWVATWSIKGAALTWWFLEQLFEVKGWRLAITLVMLLYLHTVLVAYAVFDQLGLDVTPVVNAFIASVPMVVLIDLVQRKSQLRSLWRIVKRAIPTRS